MNISHHTFLHPPPPAPRRQQKSGPGPLIQRYIAVVGRRAYYILVVWFLFFLLSAWKGFNLMKACSLTFAAPAGSKAAIAESKLADLFPKQSTVSLPRRRRRAHIHTPSFLILVTGRVSTVSALGCASKPCASLVPLFPPLVRALSRATIP